MANTPVATPSLDRETLDRAIVQMGRPEAWSPLLQRLNDGKPLRLGVFGASVAQHGGCLDQPYKRCMEFDGVSLAEMSWGEPRQRPVKGWAVSLLEHFNSLWPHPQHQLNNSALDATPAQAVLPCLFSHFPTQLDMVVLEFGSMAQSLDRFAVEAVARRLLMMRPRPLLLLLSVHAWCNMAKSPGTPPALFREGDRIGSMRYPKTPWSVVEDEASAVCERYGQACISVHRALMPHVRAGATGFSIDDITGPDCLHPVNGRHGLQYVDQMLRHYVDRVRLAYSRGGRGSGAARAPPWDTSGGKAGSAAFPTPLHRRNSVSPPAARCYSFLQPTVQNGRVNHLFQTRQPIGWQSASCAAAGVWHPTSVPTRQPPLAGLPGRRYHSAGVSGGEGCVARAPPGDECPVSRFAARLPAFLATKPQGWFFCRRALSRSAKISQGVVALEAGATLRAVVDTRVLEGEGAGAADNKSAAVHHGLQYLASYEGMGKVELRCVSVCSCSTHMLDAHRPEERASIYITHNFPIWGAVARCELQLQVLNASSPGGGTKFKVRSLVVTASAHSDAAHDIRK